ncbi:MAG: hypothetical protein H6R13_2848 [Proteobacteria bacterium]|nr:hypothetical protein [Pseudomonadota bacterium]
MHKPTTVSSKSAMDHLGEYIAGVSKFPEKFALIAANHRSSEQSLGRAAAALRSMGALNRPRHDSELRNHRPNAENSAGA